MVSGGVKGISAWRGGRGRGKIGREERAVHAGCHRESG